MAFFKFVIHYGGRLLYFTVGAGLLAGFGVSGIMAIIHRTLEGQNEEYQLILLLFISLWLLYAIFCILSELFLIRMAEKIAFQLKLGLSHQIFKKELRTLEKIGPDRLLAVLVEDVGVITSFIREVPGIFINSAVCLGCYGYMLWLSPPLFLFNLCFLFFTIAVYNMPAKMARRYLAQAREIYDETIKQFRFLTDGLKELLIHRRKRQEFLNSHLHASNEELMNRNIRAMSVFTTSKRLGELLVLANLGFLLFLFSRLLELEANILSGYILASLFAVSPLSSLSKNLAEWVRINVVLKKVQSYGFDLFEADPAENDSLPLPSKPNQGPDQLVLDDIKFDYGPELNGDRFVVGPLSLSLKSGELTFLIGGNGSGKTTLAKLLCGLYAPVRGRIRWNNEVVDNTNRKLFQQHFSVIFSDFFLFKHLVGIDPKLIKEQASGYLKALDLENKVAIRNAAFSSIDLSHGQRKRLALMASCLENRPVYIFDEWAAGQAPAFKKTFYEEFLMNLKNMNKMVIVITHDEDYFPVADRLIKIDDGKIR